MLPRLQAEDAIEPLQYFIKKLEQSDKGIIKKQINTLKKVANGLIASIETELSGTMQIKMGGC